MTTRIENFFEHGMSPLTYAWQLGVVLPLFVADELLTQFTPLQSGVVQGKAESHDKGGSNIH